MLTVGDLVLNYSFG